MLSAYGVVLLSIIGLHTQDDASVSLGTRQPTFIKVLSFRVPLLDVYFLDLHGHEAAQGELTSRRFGGSTWSHQRLYTTPKDSTPQQVLFREF